MNNGINAVELSTDELDTVAGGFAITLGDVGGFASDASNSYSLKQLQVGQQTFASPNGSYTGSVTNLTNIFSTAAFSLSLLSNIVPSTPRIFLASTMNGALIKSAFLLAPYKTLKSLGIYNYVLSLYV